MSEYADEIKRRPRMSAAQHETLVDFMAEHPGLAEGYKDNSDGRERKKIEWGELAELMNAHGDGVSKTAKQWAKYYNDMKSKKRSKNNPFKKECRSGMRLEESRNFPSKIEANRLKESRRIPFQIEGKKLEERRRIPSQIEVNKVAVERSEDTSLTDMKDDLQEILSVYTQTLEGMASAMDRIAAAAERKADAAERQATAAERIAAVEEKQLENELQGVQGNKPRRANSVRLVLG